MQQIKTPEKLSAVFKRYKDKIRTKWRNPFFDDQNHILGTGEIIGGKLLLTIYTNYNLDFPAQITPIWIDLYKPEEIIPVFPEFPSLADNANEESKLLWSYI